MTPLPKAVTPPLRIHSPSDFTADAFGVTGKVEFRALVAAGKNRQNWRFACICSLHVRNAFFMSDPKIQRALISVSDKNGLVEFAQSLVAAGVEIFSTGGTRRQLEEAGLSVHDVAAYTGFPEMMDGRLKTLHPKVFGGILCRYEHEDDMASIAQHGIHVFELVVVNLYPFEQTIAQPGVTDVEAIEQIDIGGPSLVRAAAKNFAFATVCTEPSQYGRIVEDLASHGGTTLKTRRQLARTAFERTARYDRAIADYFAKVASTSSAAPSVTRQGGELPAELAPVWKRKKTLRYGENPHQRAALYAEDARGQGHATAANLVNSTQHNGKELSYNNLLDLDSALGVVRSFSAPAVSVIKHNNPCGIAQSELLSHAARKAMAGDPVSAFGSVLGINREMDVATAKVLCEPGLFIEAIVAPGFAAPALELLTTKPKWKKNVRLVEVGALNQPMGGTVMRQIAGGVLVQDADIADDPQDAWQVVSATGISEEIRQELEFAWTVCRHVKSNAIVITRDQMLCGAGAGQMSRVDSVHIAIRKAGDRTAGSVLASDAFFPFPDSIEKASEAGVIAVIQPGGSKRDGEVIEACNECGIAMMFTGRRHFKH